MESTHDSTHYASKRTGLLLAGRNQRQSVGAGRRHVSGAELCVLSTHALTDAVDKMKEKAN